MSNPNLKENKFKRALVSPFRGLVKSISKKGYISYQYKYITHHKLDWKGLNRYTEKLQYLRLYVYPKNDLVSKCAGRVGVREYVKEQGFDELLIKTYGVFDRFEDIDFSKLPNQFVLNSINYYKKQNPSSNSFSDEIFPPNSDSFFGKKKGEYTDKVDKRREEN